MCDMFLKDEMKSKEKKDMRQLQLLFWSYMNVRNSSYHYEFIVN